MHHRLKPKKPYSINADGASAGDAETADAASAAELVAALSRELRSRSWLPMKQMDGSLRSPHEVTGALVDRYGSRNPSHLIFAELSQQAQPYVIARLDARLEGLRPFVRCEHPVAFSAMARSRLRR